MEGLDISSPINRSKNLYFNQSVVPLQFSQRPSRTLKTHSLQNLSPLLSPPPTAMKFSLLCAATLVSAAVAIPALTSSTQELNVTGIEKRLTVSNFKMVSCSRP